MNNQACKHAARRIPQIQRFRSALLRELSVYGIDDNFDRVTALGICLVLRNAYVAKYGGDVKSANEVEEYVASSDDFFKRNGFIH